MQYESLLWLCVGIPYAYVIARVMSWAFFRTKMQFQFRMMELISTNEENARGQ